MWNRMPRLAEPWPGTVAEWEMYAVCSQLRADHRRQTEQTIRRQHRQEIAAMLKAGGVVIGCLLAMATFWLVAWGLWAVSA